MQFSAADVKRGKLGSKSLSPKEGTSAYSLFQIFITEKSYILPSPVSQKKEYMRDRSIIENLKVRYGLDIRNMGNRVYVCFGTETEDFSLPFLKDLD